MQMNVKTIQVDAARNVRINTTEVQRDVNTTIEACEWYAREVEWKECE
jgi:hypothetical protein